MTKEKLEDARTSSTEFMKSLGMSEEEIQNVLTQVENGLSRFLPKKEEEDRNPELGEPISITITNGKFFSSTMVILEKDTSEAFSMKITGTSGGEDEKDYTVSDDLLMYLTDVVREELANYGQE